MAKVVIDAGHGGSDPGAVYNGREEKTDNLNLALAVGDILARNGVDVEYTRTTDVYHTPFEKAQMANRTGADYFVSIHRNALETPNTGTGVETLVYNDTGTKAEMARAVNRNLAQLGFANRGVIERPNLVVLRRTQMPAILVEAGFIDNDKDNALFDSQFENIAKGIADGILQTLGMDAAFETSVMPETEPIAKTDTMEDVGSEVKSAVQDRRRRRLYRVQVGAFANQQLAEQLATRLQMSGYPAFVLYQKPYYKVQVGAYQYLDNAVLMERRLRMEGYDTYLTTR